MKKIAAFILVCLLVFNWFGYRVTMNYIQQKNDSHLEARLDKNNYDEAELVELKIPLHLPYQTSQQHYERLDGEVQYKGTYYKYVKRKIANDTLYVKYIGNNKKNTLELAKNDFFKNTSDLNTSGTKKDKSTGNVARHSFSDYDNYLALIIPTPGTVRTLPSYPESFIIYLNNLSVKFNGQPPDRHC